ncbi:MAG: alpha/beta fold hydrolase [Coriobacteriales bacterium]|jgi:pimeloyl-ACP methyl ester carboxylesterase
MKRMEEKHFETTNGQIAYWTCGIAPSGSEPTLVFLPGLTADHRLFDLQVEFFSPEFRCFVWDPPAHGESRPYAAVDLEDWTTALHGILQEEGIGRPVLVGQSMGGYISQMYMELYPFEAAGFVSIDSSPLQRSYYNAAELWLLRHTRTMYRMFPWEKLVRKASEGVATTEYGRSLMKEMIESYLPEEYIDLVACGYRAVADAISSGRAFGLDCPTLLICGSEDVAGSTRRYNRLWGERTGLGVSWIGGAGHNSNCDAPDEVNRLIEDFLASL